MQQFTRVVQYIYVYVVVNQIRTVFFGHSSVVEHLGVQTKSEYVVKSMCDDKKEILTTNSYRERIGRGKTCRLTRPPLLQFFPFSFFPQRVAWEKFSSLIPRLQFPKKTHLRRLVTIWRSIKLTNQKMQETRHLFKKYLCTYQ